MCKSPIVSREPCFWFCAHLATVVLACLLPDDVYVCCVPCGPLGSSGACPRREKISKPGFGFFPPSWAVSFPDVTLTRLCVRPPVVSSDRFWISTIRIGINRTHAIYFLDRPPHGRHCRASSSPATVTTGDGPRATPLGTTLTTHLLKLPQPL